jgi:hypothetical protein
MKRLSLNIDDSIGVVSHSEYEREKEAKLTADELAKASKYKVRLIDMANTTARYAVDFLCEIQQIDRPADENIYTITLAIIDKDGRMIEKTTESSLSLSLRGLIQVQQNGGIVKDSEAGYFISALDKWDIGLAGLSAAQNIEQNHEVLEPTTVLA